MGLFIDHVNTVLGKLRESPITALSTDASSEAYRAQEAVRRAVQRVWNAKQWSFKIRSYVFATEAGVSAYPVFPQVGEPFSIVSDASPYVLSVISEAQFDKAVPNPTETGSPSFCRLFEYTGAWGQPTSASVVQVASTSALDTTQKVLIKGMINEQYVDYEELSLAGIGVVSSTKFFSSIVAVTKSAETVGSVTISTSSATVGVMAPSEKVFRTRILRLYPAPDAEYDITIKHFAVPAHLQSEYEDTEIPIRWDYVVDQFAFAFALQSKGQEQMSEFQTQFNVATKFLETDMAAEEFSASEEIIIPARWGYGTGGTDSWGTLPTGYGFTY